jgi:hypothetical protein
VRLSGVSSTADFVGLRINSRLAELVISGQWLVVREIKNQASKIKNTYKNSKMGNGNFADKSRLRRTSLASPPKSYGDPSQRHTGAGKVKK